MADTVRGDFPDEICSDCGEQGCAFRHWGRLVPEGKVGHFCAFCWNERMDSSERGEPPKPLGVKPPGVPEEFLDKAVRVTTKSGSVYTISKPIKEKERLISCSSRKLEFTRGRVLCLRVGKTLWIKPRDSKDPELHLWATSLVVSIEESHQD